MFVDDGENLVERVHALWYTCNMGEETNMNSGEDNNIMKTIHQQIEREILSYLEPFKDEYIEQRFEIELKDGWCSDDIYQIEVNGYYKNEYEPEKQTSFILLRFFVNYEYKQIQISNIFTKLYEI